MIDKLVIGLVLVAVGLGAWYSFEGVLKENGELRTSNAQLVQAASEQEAAFEQLKSEKKTADKAAADARKRASVAQKDFDDYRKGVRDVVASDPVVQEWAGAAVPLSVADCLRDVAPCGRASAGTGVPARSADSPDARTAVTRPRNKP